MPFTTTKPVGQFTDINGKPLDGQVFFGQPNLDPIATRSRFTGMPQARSL
jgi:hypothetical protein